ncbi:hypothetical protein [Sutcliffiella deserti]|uniref:hypothetical protein n=1 Tax=Sutcliffiella deserti TaxID=2875501 RepID=UPI001CBC8AC9|nr:hypothetical protein [Sutcliffiella deserti]
MYYHQYPQPHYYPKGSYLPVYPAYYGPNPSFRPYPEVDPTVFTESAVKMQSLMKEASQILQKLSESKEFASSVMNAAQEGKMEKVEELLKSTGIHSKMEINYTPDGINLKLSSAPGETDCCHLTIALRWKV